MVKYDCKLHFYIGGGFMKILIAPDSYKGTLTAREVCTVIANELKEKCDEIICLPLSDGGEGFSQCIYENCDCKKITVPCHNIYNQETEGFILVFGETAIVESATASGLLERKNVMQSTSYGTGELIKFAIDNGYKQIILGLGGSGCCDGGIGCLSALGAKFFDENQNIIKIPKSNDLNYIFGVNFKNMKKDINFTYACDVENEFFGKNGAAYVFATQKGARKTDVEELDNGLKRLNAFFTKDISKVKGTGAAGGICGGMYAVLGGKIKSGFDILNEILKIEEKIKGCDIVITGEGKTDSQTLMGKLPYKIAQLAKKHNKKCIVISGSIENVNFADKMISLVDDNITLNQAINNPKEILAEKSKLILQ